MIDIGWNAYKRLGGQLDVKTFVDEVPCDTLVDEIPREEPIYLSIFWGSE